MPVPGLDAGRCRKRNSLDARRGRNAAPIRLLAKAPGPIDTTDRGTEDGLRLKTARGDLPATPAAALERINAMLGPDAARLSADDVWIAYAEAGNSNYIGKYCMFLGDSTQRNIARQARKSMAFMNSHRTGAVSVPAEHPYGRTFAGRFEHATAADGRDFSRTLLGIYMLRGEHPNGPSNPSTDAIYAGIKGGTIFDVSLGIRGGDEVCDVCGNGLEEADDKGRMLCGHVPGTHRDMTDEQVEAQLARGVPEGFASFTLEDATANEVSSVYDGAVPGAGFRKALSLSAKHELTRRDLDEVLRWYAPLIRRRDFRDGPDPRPRGADMARDARTKKTVSLSALRRVLAQADIDLDEDDDRDDDRDGDEGAPPPARPASAAPAPAPAPPPARPASDTDDRLRVLEDQNRRLEQTLASEREQRERDAREQRRKTVLAEATNWADGLLRASVVAPAERDEMIALHAQAAMDDHEHPAQVNYREAGIPKKGSRVQALHALYAKRAPHGFSDEHLAPRDAPADDAGRDAAAPLYDLKPLPGHAKADPVLDAMIKGNEEYLARRNGSRGK